MFWHFARLRQSPVTADDGDAYDGDDDDINNDDMFVYACI